VQSVKQRSRTRKDSPNNVGWRYVLLKAYKVGPAWCEETICEVVSFRIQTVENVRRTFVLEGCDRALDRTKRSTPPTPKLLDGTTEANPIAMWLGRPLGGYVH